MRLAPVAVLGVVLSSAAAVFAAEPSAGRDAAQEAALDAALRAVAPGAVESFHAGNEATDRGDDVAAAAAYAKVHAAAPAFVAATRRLCTAEARSGDAEQGVRHCREALAAEPSAEDHAALAAALVRLPIPRAVQLEEATKEAAEAVRLRPDGVFAHVTQCEVATIARDRDALDRCSARLAELAPSAAITHFFVADDRLAHAALGEARSELEKAKAAGIDPKLYDGLRLRITAAETLAAPTTSERLLGATKAGLAGWLGGLVLLLAFGGLLGATVGRRPNNGVALRRAYAAAVILTTLYFYASLLVMVVAVTTAVTALVLGAAPLGHSIMLRLGLASSVFVYAAFAIARAMTTYDDEAPPGVRVSLADEPKLEGLLKETAAAVRARPVDAVQVVAGDGLEIVERGGALDHLRGKSERVLVLGFDVLGATTLRTLRKRLALQYARWRRPGGAGGSVALAMRRTLGLALQENASAFNPARWLLRGWSALYERISNGAVVEQERLAERWAEQAYGDDAAERDDDAAAARTLVTDRDALRARLRNAVPVSSQREGHGDESDDEQEDAEEEAEG